MPEITHLVTQRGTNRQVVFLSQSDRKVYLDLLRENARTAGVAIPECCLMPNHIHLVAEPAEELALATMLRREMLIASMLASRRRETGRQILLDLRCDYPG